MADRLFKKVALITAAGQGIGEATAIAFAKEGAEVFATDKSISKLKKFKKFDNITTLKLDVLNNKEISSIQRKIKIPDILFNCAGYVHQGTIMECTEKDWDFSFELNVKSNYLLTKSVLPNMIKNGGGNIINVSSVVSSIKGLPNRYVYGATKAAIIGMTKSLAIDYVKNNIRINSICPGTVDTPSLAERIKAIGNEKVAREKFISRQPMGRLGKPEEIANLAVYLASDESKFITGQSFTIDGGISI